MGGGGRFKPGDLGGRGGGVGGEDWVGGRFYCVWGGRAVFVFGVFCLLFLWVGVEGGLVVFLC